MKSGVIGTTVSLIILILMLVVGPAYYVGIIQYARDSQEVLLLMRNLIDEVIDVDELSETSLDRMQMQLATLNGSYEVKAYREIRTINPDPSDNEKIETVYIRDNDVSHFDPGDLITVEVKTLKQNSFLTIGRAFFGQAAPKDNYTLTGRVR